MTRPALFVAGEQDLVIAGVPADALVDALRGTLTDLRGATLLPGCGHWTQQERPEEVSAAIIGFAGDVS
ncbi:alpha/beta fold hydrolase [Pseudonocardia adelaidensis]|uniref:alpha/beta fold hydrolase n=1 Tax=Pseudonocardia adelaidensis TaxID=648754 RepID=UPI003CD07E4A